jgi:protein SCO1/2
LTPHGHISKYFYGIEFSARDLRLGLIEASEERIGTLVDDVLLFCYHYDPATGKYGAAVLRLVRVAGIATVLAFLSFLTVSLRRERAAGLSTVDPSRASGWSRAQSSDERRPPTPRGPRGRPEQSRRTSAGL